MYTFSFLFMETSDKVAQHVSAMGIIFAISLLAVAFPALSKKIRFLSIPKILFFIGKHFGTGVILSTAFCHLLQDSFEALTSSIVKSRYPGVGEQTGFIILASLITIFLVEYVSTSYVDHLHEESEASASQEHPQREPTSSSQVQTAHKFHPVNESTHLLSASVGSTFSSSALSGSVRSHHSLEASFIRSPPRMHHYLSSIVTNSPRYSRGNDCFYIINDLNYHLNNGEYHLVGGKGSCVCVCVCPAGKGTETMTQGARSRLVVQSPEDVQHDIASNYVPHDDVDDDDVESQRPILSRKRQVVGILVLQLGIMIHSLVIGLTLSITSGAEFTTLVTAIIFHQLFEGLSLGIRIAAIPPDEGVTSPRPSRSSSPSASLARKSHHSVLQPVLTILFALTTPLGIALGMLVFSSQRGKTSEARMLLTQGLMSAISAGMLIYAATVEMMAGDFVFGNLGGHGTGTAGHGHSHGSEFINGDDEDDSSDAEEEGISPRRRVLAVGSLLAGVLAMGLIGLGE
ncbi:ZIP zinc transporter-domain-containing protein [Lentinula edodes]|uniref:ZIP zinc transporter-domain-containing protein n=1 Tax=Lentinula lateritia TaxID=40482 RepID=A0A9W9AYP1_9AGAR|nr:ZIP zinc transporter-domain-containing protein [Lentinula edodes]